MRIAMGVLLAVLVGCRLTVAAEAVDRLLEQVGSTPALVAVVCGERDQDPRLVAQLVERTPWTVLCRSDHAAVRAKLRAWAAERRVLGERVYVLDGAGDALWLAGDMADAVWVLPSVERPPAESEIMRVLRPGGAYLKAGEVTVKPVPEGVDEWRHPYRSPDNNVVSTDRFARLPGELRFQTRPVFAAMPNQSLFACGRIFFFTGHIAFHAREEPLLNRLTVLNAYNGLTLWSRPLDPNCVVHNFCKVATEREVVYAEGDVLRMLDAATGQERGSYRVPEAAAAAGDTDWKWIVQQGDTLWAACGPPDGRVAPYRLKREMGHWPWDVANRQYRVIVENFGAAHRLLAYRFPEMELLWSVTEPEAFDVRALCLEGGRIFQMAPGEYLAARESRSGKLLWRRTPQDAEPLFQALGSALKRQGWGLGWATFCCARASQGIVCLAGPPFQQSIGIDLQEGKLLWTSAAESPHPFFLDDRLYVMPRVAMPAAVCQMLDPRTGKLLKEFKLGVIGSCTRLTVTPNQFFYRPGGGEGRTVYFDLQTERLADYEGVVRPGCFDGVVPANGRLYWMPLACDCWQVHGTFCMAPRTPPRRPDERAVTKPWSAPQTASRAGPDDWPVFRADVAGSATVAAPVPRSVTVGWQRRLTTDHVTAPICVGPRVYVGGADGTLRALELASGRMAWQRSTPAALTLPPAYWHGRLLAGSGDGQLYCVDAQSGQLLGRTELAPERRLVNIMNRLMSPWPLGGGVLVDSDGIAYTAAGSTAADGTVVAAVEASTGKLRWRRFYAPDADRPKPSFGVQANLLLHDDTLLVNGGAPVGIVALDTASGATARVVQKLEAGSEMFLEPDGQPFCTGPELYTDQWARTTIFKRHQGRAYFRAADRYLALVDGRLFCAAEPAALDRVVELMNQDPRTGGKLVGDSVPRDVMQVPASDDVLWAGRRADVQGLAIGADGLVALHRDRVRGISLDGQTLWDVPLPAAPVRWGMALTGKACVVTLTDGHVVCLR